MAYTTSDLDTIIVTLETALGSGVADVQFDNRRITYRSQDEILKGLSYFKALRDGLDAPSGRRARQIRMIGSKGL